MVLALLTLRVSDAFRRLQRFAVASIVSNGSQCQFTNCSFLIRRCLVGLVFLMGKDQKTQRRNFVIPGFFSGNMIGMSQYIGSSYVCKILWLGYTQCPSHVVKHPECVWNLRMEVHKFGF